MTILTSVRHTTLYRIRRPKQHDLGLNTWLVWYNNGRLMRRGKVVEYDLVPPRVRLPWRLVLMARRKQKYYLVSSEVRVNRLAQHFTLEGYPWLP